MLQNSTYHLENNLNKVLTRLIKMWNLNGDCEMRLAGAEQSAENPFDILHGAKPTNCFALKKILNEPSGKWV